MHAHVTILYEAFYAKIPVSNDLICNVCGVVVYRILVMLLFQVQLKLDSHYRHYEIFDLFSQ